MSIVGGDELRRCRLKGSNDNTVVKSMPINSSRTPECRNKVLTLLKDEEVMQQKELS